MPHTHTHTQHRSFHPFIIVVLSSSFLQFAIFCVSSMHRYIERERTCGKWGCCGFARVLALALIRTRSYNERAKDISIFAIAIKLWRRFDAHTQPTYRTIFPIEVHSCYCAHRINFCNFNSQSRLFNHMIHFPFSQFSSNRQIYFVLQIDYQFKCYIKVLSLILLLRFYRQVLLFGRKTLNYSNWWKNATSTEFFLWVSIQFSRTFMKHSLFDAEWLKRRRERRIFCNCFDDQACRISC